MRQKISHRFVIGFLYPAVLGSTLYTVIDVLVFQGGETPLAWSRILLTLVILCVFICDYLYTIPPKLAQHYTPVHAALDIAIAITCFLVVRIALEGDGDVLEKFAISSDAEVGIYVLIATLLCVKKLFGFYWEIIENFKHHSNFGAKLFLIFFVFYGGIAVFGDFMPNAIFPLLMVILIADFAVYACSSFFGAGG